MASEDSKPVVIQKQVSLPAAKSSQPLDSEEESGLVFVDPEVERRAQLEKEKFNKKKEIPVLKLKDGTVVQAGNFLSGMTGGGGGPSGPNNASAQDKGGRFNFLQNLKNEQIKKRSQNITFDKVKETFMRTELTSEPADAAKKRLDAAKSQAEKDAPLGFLAGELIEEDENDEEYEEGAGEEEAEESLGEEEDEGERWDDENEEIIRPSRKSRPDPALEGEAAHSEGESQDQVGELPASLAQSVAS